MESRVITAVLLVAAAIAVSVVGGQTRPYPAFGGEDVLALVLIGAAVMGLISKREDEI